MELLKVDRIEEAKKKIEPYVNKYLYRTKEVEIIDSLDKILGEDIYTTINVPHFRRSSVDGYAVIYTDTQGASDTIPVFLKVIDEVDIGTKASKAIKSGECVYVPTGGMLPENANAMVMVEYTEMFSDNEVAIYESVPYSAHVVQVGEDVNEGELVLTKGTRIRAQEVGAMAAIGKTHVKVYEDLNVSVISTGDELVSIDEELEDAKIYDINTYTLLSLCKKYTMSVKRALVVKDNEEILRNTIKEAMNDSDIVLVSGGSSKGKKDVSAKVLDELSSSGVLTHGISIKPGKPTITAFDEDSKTLLIGLPGHPVAAMMLFEVLVVSVVLQGLGKQDEKILRAKMKTNVVSAPGRTTLQLVSLSLIDGEYYAEPIYGKSGLITTLTKADGYVVIELNTEGLKKDENVTVHIF